MSSPRNPPFTITPRILRQVAECCERVGSWRGGKELPLSPQLRRENRVLSIQASLAIENNSISIDQVTDILGGKRVMGLPREIHEVKNAIACYDQLGNFDPTSVADFLKAHGILMQALADDAGTFRSGVIGVYREGQLIHMAPPADRISQLIADLYLAGFFEGIDYPGSVHHGCHQSATLLGISSGCFFFACTPPSVR